MTVDVQNLKEKYSSLAKIFHLDELKKELDQLDGKIAEPSFWNDPKGAAQVQKRRSYCSDTVSLLKSLETDIHDIEEFAPLAQGGDQEILREVQTKLSRVEKTMEDLEFRRLLSGEHDGSHAILMINSGAGGTEAQDWVQMLLRMYVRWVERKKFKYELADSLPGEGAGFKSVTLMIEGPFAYGLLKSEIGIHRLVRISPFDANARRHTSFASVMILPQLDDEVEIEIQDDDLRIDTYRSSGAGGQHVNKTDSAVRLTHIPTGIVVACQNERSQHKNKAHAMKVLKAKLYELEMEQKVKEKEKLAGEKKEINFGSQIRSYVLQPYQMIKDHRTDFEMGNVQAVLDGDLDGFIRAFLLQKAATQ